MNINEFSNQIKVCVEQRLQNGESVRINPMWKNNGVRLIGLCIMEQDTNIAPTFYLEDYFARFEQGESIDRLVDELLMLHKKYQMEQKLKIDFFVDYEKAKERIACKLVNRKMNEEILKKIPYVEYLDLAIVFYYLMDNEMFGSGTILIHTTHLEMWKITKEELYQTAMQNVQTLLPRRLIKMENMLLELVRSKEQEEQLMSELEGQELPMYVMTNNRKTDGAIALLYPESLADATNVLGGNFYVIPSSVHEVILVRDLEEEQDENVLNAMVREVNETQLDYKEVLSDHVYYYDQVVGELVSCVSE